MSSRSRLLLPSRSRPSCRQGQCPAFAITTEAKVKTQQSTPLRKLRPPEPGPLLTSRSRNLLSTRPRLLLSRSCCHQGQGSAAAITSEVKVTDAARGKPPADANITTIPTREDPHGEVPAKDETPADDHTPADLTEAEGYTIPKSSYQLRIPPRSRSSSLLSFLERELPESRSLPPPKMIARSRRTVPKLKSAKVWSLTIL